MRKPIGKARRFAIFARDGFACRYCGRQSDSVKLEVDHIIPVCQGGTDDEANLISSCEDCNRGKGGKTIEQSAPTETDRLRLLQELREQQEAARAAADTAAAREELEQEVVNFWCGRTGRDSMNRRCLSIVLYLIKQHGVSLVFSWIEIAADRMRGKPDHRISRYLCGIRKSEGIT